MNKEEIPKLFKGSKENPVTNIFDLSNAMIGRKDSIIYVKGTFELNEKVLFEIEVRNIEIKILGDSNTAKEMFENIERYELVKYENNEDLIMYQLVDDYYYNDYIHHLKGQYLEIIFDKKHQCLNIVQEDCENYRTITSIINMQIYKAINKQVEELGWNNE